MSKPTRYLGGSPLFSQVDTTIYRTRDTWGEIEVIDGQGIRQLYFDDGYTQSSVDLAKPHVLVHDYTRAMMLVYAFIKPRRVTLLGLGGGCLLRSIHHAFPECEIDIVELRQQVYEVACEFFGVPDSPRIHVNIADANQALRRMSAKSSQIIFSDLYHAQGMDHFQAQRRFVDSCLRVLSDDAWLVINYHQLPKIKSPFYQYLKRQFVSIFACPVTTTANYILFACRHKVDELVLYHEHVKSLEKLLDCPLRSLFGQMKRLL